MEGLIMSEAIDNRVVVMSFSIFGVPGFKTVRAEGADAKRRMRAVVNDIDRKFKDKLDVVSYKPSKEETAMNETAASLLSGITDQIRAANDYDMLVADEDLQFLTTEEFFTVADTIYAKNYDLFMEKLPALAEGCETYYAAKRAAARKPEATEPPLELSLYCITGGPFGTAQFHYAITNKSIVNDGGSIAVVAIRKAVVDHLRSVKNFRLSDYLRTSVAWRAGYRTEIEMMDAMMAAADQITATYVTSLTSKQATRAQGGKHKTGIVSWLSAMEAESTARLQDFFAEMKIYSDSDGTRTNYGFKLPADLAATRLATVLAGRTE
jgi:hypothetical protein